MTSLSSDQEIDPPTPQVCPNADGETVTISRTLTAADLLPNPDNAIFDCVDVVEVMLEGK